MTLPSLHIEGLIYGSPFVELDKSTSIVSSSGFVSKIDYSGRGWMSGKKNTFTATLSKAGSKDVLYTIEGHWNETFTIHEGSSKKGNVVDTWNSAEQKTSKLKVEPIEAQDPRESNRAWKSVADAIIKGDMDTTSREKSKIENAQRELRKKEQAEGKEWPRTFFSKKDNAEDSIVELAKTAAEPIEPDKTGGVWRFDKDKAQKAKKPYDPAF
jgi:oxysterol-binding protein-related protein 9/10/11